MLMPSVSCDGTRRITAAMLFATGSAKALVSLLVLWTFEEVPMVLSREEVGASPSPGLTIAVVVSAAAAPLDAAFEWWCTEAEDTEAVSLTLTAGVEEESANETDLTFAPGDDEEVAEPCSPLLW